jgi:FkbM family methyltransferase
LVKCFIQRHDVEGPVSVVDSEPYQVLRVVAFEPTPDHAARLREHAAMNGVEIELMDMGLGATQETAVLHKISASRVVEAGSRPRITPSRLT